MKSPDPPVQKEQPLSRPPFPARIVTLWQNLSGSQRSRLKGFLIFGVLLLLAFIKPLVSLMVYASGEELHSHIVLVPLVSIYLIAIDRRLWSMEFHTSRTWGLCLAGTGLILLIASFLEPAGLSSVNDRHVLPVLSFVVLLGGGGFLFLGRRWMIAAAFPVAFLLFMAPLPDAWVEALESFFRLASAEATEWYFKLAGIPFLRDGTVFQLPGTTIEVAQECSGIRSSWVLFITSLIAAHMFLKSPWRKLLFVTLVIPLGILRNGLRILVISWLCVEVNPEMIHHWIHKRGGPIFFGLSLVPLFLVLWWLRRSESRAGFKMRPLPEVPATAVG